MVFFNPYFIFFLLRSYGYAAQKSLYLGLQAERIKIIQRVILANEPAGRRVNASIKKV
jgi:hypothetical protein